MVNLLFSISVAIQIIAIVMILHTYRKIAEHRFPQLDALEKYHLMRKRYEHLRMSLLFVVALIVIQLAGLFFYTQSGLLTPVLTSDLVIVALIIFLTTIYKERDRMSDMEFEKKEEKKK